MSSYSTIAEAKSFRIIKVCVVEGRELHNHWRNPMHKIYANPPPNDGKDFYIDNMAGEKYGFHNHPDAFRGYEWREHIGETVKNVNVIQHGGYLWLNKAPSHC